MRKIIVEACVDNIESAVSAQAAGADRVELCSALLEGGLTPSYGLIKAAKKYLDIPIHALIRPRRGDFLYSQKELEIMQDDIEFCQDLGIDAVVFAALTENAEVDIKALNNLQIAGGQMKTTFHRAFDMLSHPIEAIEKIIDLGFDSILTSGFKNSAENSLEELSEVVKAARGRIEIIAAAGINERNVVRIVKQSGVGAIHASARAKSKSKMRRAKSQISLSAAYYPTEDEHYMLSPKNIKSIRLELENLYL